MVKTGDELTELEIEALRALRPIAEKAIHLFGEGLARGVIREERETDLRHSFQALSVIDRLTGDGPRVYTQEEQSLVCIRVGNVMGYAVNFAPDGDVVFERGDFCVAVPDLIGVDEPIEAMLEVFLGAVAERRDEFFRWLASTRNGGSE